MRSLGTGVGGEDGGGFFLYVCLFDELCGSVCMLFMIREIVTCM